MLIFDNYFNFVIISYGERDPEEGSATQKEISS